LKEFPITLWVDLSSMLKKKAHHVRISPNNGNVQGSFCEKDKKICVNKKREKEKRKR
jgi:hypothetical protein